MEHPRPVTLDEILAAREKRAARQRALLAAYPGKTLICLMVNIPGPVKLTKKAERVFFAGLNALKNAFAAAGLPVAAEQRRMLHTGCEAYVLVDAVAESVKRIACELEERLPYGRLLDVDVHTADGQISRTQLGIRVRGCMVCGRDGAYCASRRIHSLTELLAAFERLAALAPEERA